MGIASRPSRSKVPAYHLTPFGGGELKSLLSRFVQLLEGHAAIQGRDAQTQQCPLFQLRHGSPCRVHPCTSHVTLLQPKRLTCPKVYLIGRLSVPP